MISLSPGIYFCRECFKPLAINEFGLCSECRKNKEQLKPYEIKRIGKLSLGYKTFFNRKAFDDEIEICMWDEGFSHRWTIASFDYNERENAYDLIGNEYLFDVKDWKAFGELVQKGYDILKNFKVIY